MTKPEHDDDTDDTENMMGIVVQNNSIFFYTDVTRTSIMNLCKEIRKLESKLQKLKIEYKLNEDPKIYLHIQSDGGDAYAGLSAMDFLKRCTIPIVTLVDGFVASAATFILLGGKEVKMNEHSHILIHQIRTQFWGKFDELCDEMKNSANLMNMVRAIYRENSSMPKKVIDTLLTKELYLSAEECLRYKIVDEII